MNICLCFIKFSGATPAELSSRKSRSRRRSESPSARFRHAIKPFAYSTEIRHSGSRPQRSHEQPLYSAAGSGGNVMSSAPYSSYFGSIIIVQSLYAQNSDSNKLLRSYKHIVIVVHIFRIFIATSKPLLLFFNKLLLFISALTGFYFTALFSLRHYYFY